MACLWMLRYLANFQNKKPVARIFIYFFIFWLHVAKVFFSDDSCSFTAELKVETNVILNCACYVYFQVAYVIYL